MIDKKTTTFLLVMVIALALSAVAVCSVEPATPTITYVTNSTVGGVGGANDTHHRGYIHYVDIDASSPTQKWKAYVGNISGEYSLADASGNAIYDWSIATITGEIYATKEAPSGGSGRYAGGIPTWSAIQCANSTMMTDEESLFNHTAAEDDSYSNTFLNGNNFNLTTFYAGQQQVTDTSVIGGVGDCYGAYLMVNNTDQTTDWEEVVLTDGTYEDEGSGDLDYDIIYAALLENNAYGFDSVPYDFQMLLPESGLEGSQTPTTYYFYIELI
ncbi:hypothetical protein ACFL3V_04265 [Nanoarchaeota archaeon]